jgi:uncharacterized protein YcfJ
MWVIDLILAAGLAYCIKHIRKLNRILDSRGAPVVVVPPPVVQPPSKTPREICRDLMDEHERRYHGR